MFTRLTIVYFCRNKHFFMSNAQVSETSVIYNNLPIRWRIDLMQTFTSLTETIQVQEPRKAVYNLSKAITIWLSFNIRLAATGAWIHILLDSAHDGKFIYLRYR